MSGALELACLGYYPVDDCRVRNKVNRCLIRSNDGEHKCCKGGIRITRTFPAYRISRRIAPAQPFFHPLRCDPGWPNAVYDIAHEAIDAFDQLVRDEKWPPLHDLFMTSIEKRKRDESNSNLDGCGDCPNAKKSRGNALLADREITNH
jgi:hypothetical protein